MQEFAYFQEQDSEQFAFYKIPKVLFTDPRFNGISTEAKIMYGVMLDRVSLSRKNGWIDENGNVYIQFTLSEMMEYFHCEVKRLTRIEYGFLDLGNLRQGQYRRLLDVFFLPTLRMYEYVPCRFDCKVQELPSGCEIVPCDAMPAADGRLRVLYVGGIGGDYNILPLVKAASSLDGVSLTVCCRTYDWEVVKEEYMPYVGGNVKVVHLKGKDVENLYRNTDLFAMPHCTEYVRFAAPYKLFEAVGQHTPLLAAADTWSGDFVERNGIGLTSLNDVNALRTTLSSIMEHPETMATYKKNIPAVAENNTWTARCRQIANALLKKEV